MTSHTKVQRERERSAPQFDTLTRPLQCYRYLLFTSTSLSFWFISSSPIFVSNIMEEVWKDINLATLNDQTTRPTTTHSMNLGGVMFQDFLGNIDPPNTILSSASASSQTPSLYCPPTPSPAPPLVTALSLSSRPHFHFDSLITHKPQHPAPAPSNISCLTNHTLASSVNCKRYHEPAAPDCALGDRRNKRMIKNRESAARSRARKQENITSFFCSLICAWVGRDFYVGQS